MGRPKLYATEADRRRAQDERRKRERKEHPQYRTPEFIAVDGEGTGRGADHKYVLLGMHNADQTVWRAVENPDGLGLEEIFTFLWGGFLLKSNAVFTGFFLGYDFTRWLRMLPLSKAERLFNPSLRQRRGILDKKTGELVPDPKGPFPVTWQGWEFDILGVRRFKLKPEKAHQWMYICDAGPYFQSSLMTAIDPQSWPEPIVSEEEYELLEQGKKRRDHAVLDDDMRSYNALENRVLCRLMGRLAGGMEKTGVHLGRDQWYGPGQAAQQWMGNIGCPTREMVCETLDAHRPDRDLFGTAVASYYGGWFEIFAHGHVPGESWEYDINSAYPYVIAALPCLLHGAWRSDARGVDSGQGRTSYRLVRARVLGSDPVCGGILSRRADHSIYRPARSEGWYWEHELAAGIRAGVIDTVQVTDGVRYEPCDCPPPLRGIAGLYDERLRVGKDTPEGKALKIIYNSVYGKTAQSLGEPRFANPVYASLTTSGTRTMILDAIATHPGGTRELLMVATDGIYFRSQHPALRTGPALGDWSESRKRNLCLFKPGVYWDDETRQRIRDRRDPRFKARGISAKQFASSIATVDADFARWDGVRPFPSVEFASGFSMVTCTQALAWGRWHDAGAVNDAISVVQDSDPAVKRQWTGEQDRGIWRSKPWGNEEWIATVPYDKNFGQPDPQEYGINDDGNVGEQWRLR